MKQRLHPALQPKLTGRKRSRGAWLLPGLAGCSWAAEGWLVGAGLVVSHVYTFFLFNLESTCNPSIL